MANTKRMNYVSRNEIHVAVPTVPELNIYKTETDNTKCKR